MISLLQIAWFVITENILTCFRMSATESEIAFSNWFLLASMRQTIRSSCCCAFAITFPQLSSATPERFLRDSCRCDDSWMDRESFIRPFSLPLYQSRAIVPSRLDIYMAIAGAPTPPAGVCAPRPELKPPHYHGES